jgi:hypothetical protein
MDKKTIIKGLHEFKEQALILSNADAGGGYNYYIISMLYCLMRYGARPLDYVRFEFAKKSARERNRYLTFFRYFRLLEKFGYYNAAIHGKVALYKTYCQYIRRPWMVADGNTDSNILDEFISNQGIVFAKPDRGEQGKGVMKIRKGDNDAIDELKRDCKKAPYVVEGVIEQIPEIAVMNPSSVNTVRAFTLLKRNGETQILAIELRVGREGSHVDNWGAGGICYNFDLETGICVDYGRDKKNNPYVYNPDSNVQMIGFRLPDFDNLKKTIVELSQLVPQARFVGWDIAITPYGYELVEMNCPGGHDILQAFGKPYYDVLKRELI